MPLAGKQKVTIGSICGAMALVIIGMLTGDAGIIGNLLIIALFVFIAPFILYRYSHLVWIKSIEGQFPNFVRDIADSVRSGMSFKEAISIASRSDYGKLTEEVKKMSNRLSWGTPFARVLDIFGKEVKDSKLITESLTIIKESSLSGGNIAATLDAIARDMVMFKEIEAERVSMLRQHVFIMYGIFFMFMGISVMIIYVMVPMIKTQPGEGTAMPGAFGVSFSNPCEDVPFFPCDYFSALGTVFNLPPGVPQYYTAMFFNVVLVQAIFTGLIAGQLGENSVVAGSKHSLMMVAATVGVFLFLAKTGMIPT